MTFARVNGGGWALFEQLTSAQMNALDINMTRALDGDAGGEYSPSSALKVWGKIIGESVVSRKFLYPIACGEPDRSGALAEGEWRYEIGGTSPWWESMAVDPQMQMQFDLNRLVPQGATIIAIRVRVDPSALQADRADRLKVSLESRNNTGDDQIVYDETCYPEGGSHAEDWLELISGIHDGGDGQAILADSFKSWPVNLLVGRTIYNVTDGSSGVITANTAPTVTAPLSGGTDDDWDDDDVYSIALGETVNSDARSFYLVVTSSNGAQTDLLIGIEITYTDPADYLRTP